MASDKLPKELERIRSKVRYLQKVASEPAMGHAELDELEEKVTLKCLVLTSTQHFLPGLV